MDMSLKEVQPIVTFTTVHGNGDFHFVKPVTAKFVKFKILEWHAHISMRCDVFVDGVLKDFPESSRTYSSVYGHDAARIQAHSRSSLNSPRTWGTGSTSFRPKKPRAMSASPVPPP